MVKKVSLYDFQVWDELKNVSDNENYEFYKLEEVEEKEEAEGVENE